MCTQASALNVHPTYYYLDQSRDPDRGGELKASGTPPRSPTPLVVRFSFGHVFSCFRSSSCSHRNEDRLRVVRIYAHTETRGFDFMTSLLDGALLSRTQPVSGARRSRLWYPPHYIQFRDPRQEGGVYQEQVKQNLQKNVFVTSLTNISNPLICFRHFHSRSGPSTQ